ncbi:ABC transporter substrate-binding protein [Pseudomonas cavernae]|uniref:ABC transporter substrate-binding protein n=2 Tax=Pseudomonas cavernae TaxID=2320867 RepID=A0A385ZAR4_9PSED|nr:ABC transporter substrate-binding protein [Pseudomonas cavernae]
MVAARAETLVITADVWCPINCAAAADKPGILVELAQQIFAEAGITVEYQTVNWARAIHAVRQGRANALIGAGREDAPDFLFSASAPAISRTCFYVKPDSAWRYQGVDSLADVRLSVINGYSYGPDLDDYIRHHQHEPAKVQTAAGDRALATNVAKLLRGRVDVTLENSRVMASHLARRQPPAQLWQAGCRSPDLPIYLAFSPTLASSPRYVALFEAGLQRYRQNGRLQALLARYGVREDW